MDGEHVADHLFQALEYFLIGPCHFVIFLDFCLGKQLRFQRCRLVQWLRSFFFFMLSADAEVAREGGPLLQLFKRKPLVPCPGGGLQLHGRHCVVDQLHELRPWEFIERGHDLVHPQLTHPLQLRKRLQELRASRAQHHVQSEDRRYQMLVSIEGWQLDLHGRSARHLRLARLRLGRGGGVDQLRRWRGLLRITLSIGPHPLSGPSRVLFQLRAALHQLLERREAEKEPSE